MIPARAVRLYTAAVFFFWIFVSGVFMAGGGLGLAGSIGFIGLMWAPFLVVPAGRAFLERREAQLAALALAYVALSLLWSPYDRPDQAVKLVLLTPLFALVPFSVARLDEKRRMRFAAFTAIIAVIVGLYLLVEAAFGAPIALSFKQNLEGWTGDPADLRALADRTLSRGASAFILLAGPLTIWLWTRSRRLVAAFLTLCAVFAATGFEVEANTAGLILATAAAAAAWRWPRRALPGLFYAVAAFIVFAPMVLGAVVALTPDGVAGALPLSWHQRLEIWAYALERVSEAPVFGHGLDASRTMEDEIILRGVALHLLPLHPHNAGLHIWMETGALGAGLVGAAFSVIGLVLRRVAPNPEAAAGIAFVTAGWFTMTTLGYGVWQEWHHGALALALAGAMFSLRRQRPR